MLRDKSLIPLSRQHQHALALCVRIDRAAPIPDADLETWQAEIAQHFQAEIGIHFAAEEKVLFPAARRFKGLSKMVSELLADHVVLRERFAQAENRSLSAAEMSAFGKQLTAHIRKEERQLFEDLQKQMSPEELERLGQKLDDALRDSAQACALPAKAARLRSTK